jgi:hypothetical protein
MKDQELRLGGEHIGMIIYSDMDFAGDMEDRKSTGGYTMFVGEGAIS